MPLRRVDGDERLRAIQDAVQDELRRIERKGDRLRISEPLVKSGQAGFGQVLRVDPTRGAIAVQLPVIEPKSVGRTLRVVEVAGSTNTITLWAGKGATINGAASHASSTAYDSRHLVALSTTKWAVL